MNTMPTGDQLPDDPHLAEDIGVGVDSPSQDLTNEPLPTGQTNAGQQVSGVREAGTPSPGATPDPGTGGRRRPTSD